MSAIPPAVVGVNIRGNGSTGTPAATQQLAPLAGDTGQTASYATAWIAVPPGSTLQLELAVASLSAGLTASFSIETCNQVNPATGVAVDTPREIGFFNAPTAGIANQVFPMQGAGVCDNNIRVVATVGGVGGGATCVWAITGQLIEAASAQST